MTIKSEYERLTRMCKDSYNFSKTLENVKQYTCASDYIKKGIIELVQKDAKLLVTDKELDIVTDEEYIKESEILKCIYRSVK